MISSTPNKKTLLNTQQNDNFLRTLEAEVNDDREREKRRSIYHVEQSLSSVPDSSLVSSATNEQIVRHIKACQKLSNENKINIRNAWDVKVIDYIYQYVFKNTILDSHIMLEGARTLEVCVKVYGYKVDYLNQEVIKLISSKKAAVDKDTSAVEDDMHNETGNKQKKVQKRKKRHPKASVAKEKNDLLMKEIPKVVPIDFVGSVDIYASNHQNMFTNKILMEHAAYKFSLLNDVDRGFISYNDEDATLKEKLCLNMFPEIKSLAICPEFRNFNVDEEDEAFNDSIVGILSETGTDKNRRSILNSIHYDDDGVPVPILDGSMHDIFAENADTIEYEDVEVVGQAAQRRIEMLTSFCPPEMTQQTDESVHLFNGFLETVWVGPSHWKNKLLRQSVPKYSGKPDEKNLEFRKRRKTTHIKPANTPIDMDDTCDFDYEKLCRSYTSWNTKKCTLPPNSLFVLSDLDTMMLQRLNPKCHYRPEKADNEFEHSPYNYDNANDSQYCSQTDLPEAENIDDHVGNEDVIQNKTAECFNSSGALIDAPDLVTQVYVPYALRAKNINMKKLKAAMLSCLMCNNNEVITEELQIQPSMFVKVLKKLPGKLPKKVRSEVSVPLAFFSLLHLANEHNLELVGSKTLDEISVEPR